MNPILSIFAYVLTSLFHLHMVEFTVYQPLARADPRVRVVSRNGFSWDTYSYLAENGDLDVDITPWEKCAFAPASNLTKHSYTRLVHPELHFVTHIPQTIHGEQLVAQLFRCIPERSWLFKYGRIPMSFILTDWVWRVGFSFWLGLKSSLTVFRESPHRSRPRSDVN